MEDLASEFFEDLKNDGMMSVMYLKSQGGSEKWINSLKDRCMNCSQRDLDLMKADLNYHFRLVEQKKTPLGEKWERKAPKNITAQIVACEKCKEDRMTQHFDYEHNIDMHPELFLYVGNGTDYGLDAKSVEFKTRQRAEV